MVQLLYEMLQVWAVMWCTFCRKSNKCEQLYGMGFFVANVTGMGCHVV